MSFELTIVTPQGEAFRGPVERVVLPGSEGEFGVLTGHERFLTPLQIGPVAIHSDGEVQWAAIAEGFAEVNGAAVTVLVESGELAADIDVAEAEHARERAEQGLASLNNDENAKRYAAYSAAIERARVRIEVSRKAQG